MLINFSHRIPYYFGAIGLEFYMDCNCKKRICKEINTRKFFPNLPKENSSTYKALTFL